MTSWTVLLAEDDEAVRESLRGEFEAYGFRVWEADGVDQALEILARESIDVVVLDMRMPDDIAGIRMLRASAHFGLAGAAVPIIVFTAFESYSNCVEAIKAGAYDYIPKKRVGSNTVRELVLRCKQAITGPCRPGSDLDEEWAARHFDVLLERYGGKRVAILPVDAGLREKLSDADELDGQLIIVADDFEELRAKLMADPAVRDRLPFMALLPRESDREE